MRMTVWGSFSLNSGSETLQKNEKLPETALSFLLVEGILHVTFPEN